MKYFLVLLILIGFVTESFVSYDIFAEEPKVCGQDAIFVDGICKIIRVESGHYVNTSPFYQSLLLFSIFLWPYFIFGSAIFIVLAKTPKYKKSTRIAVTLFGLLVIGLFLVMMFIGIWPQMGG